MIQWQRTGFVPAGSLTADAEAEKGAAVGGLAKFKSTILLPFRNVKVAAQVFTAPGSEELAVVDDKCVYDNRLSQMTYKPIRTGESR
jgi:hypothetical protein